MAYRFLNLEIMIANQRRDSVLQIISRLAFVPLVKQ